MIVITGGAGFIGSALLWALNKKGREDILIVDELDHDEKEHNLAGLKYEELVGIKDFRKKLLAGEYDKAGIEVIFHLGACSSTTETDWDYLLDNNVEYTKVVIRWCADHNVRCIYASSAATYGAGEHGYSDDHKLFDQLKPLNLYGQSKLLVDIWARDGKYLDKVVSLRYFNVFGPNENHKGEMRSVIAKKYPLVAREGVIELFKSHNPDYADGEQRRDFLYIKDAVAMTLFFWENPHLHGIFNIGTGIACSWNEVAKAMFSAAKKKPNITYIEMPRNVRNQYQYFTQADISTLRAAGYKNKITPLNDAITDYITNYLGPHQHLEL